MLRSALVLLSLSLVGSLLESPAAPSNHNTLRYVHFGSDVDVMFLAVINKKGKLTGGYHNNEVSGREFLAIGGSYKKKSKTLTMEIRQVGTIDCNNRITNEFRIKKDLAIFKRSRTACDGAQWVAVNTEFPIFYENL